MEENVQLKRRLEKAEYVSGLLVFLLLVAELCFAPLDVEGIRTFAYVDWHYALLSLCVVLHTGLLLCHAIRFWGFSSPQQHMLLLRLLIGICGSVLLLGTAVRILDPQYCWYCMLMALILGVFTLVRLGEDIRAMLPASSLAQYRMWNSSVIFFICMFSLVFASTLMLMAPGSCVHPISFADAFFMSVSAASNTGLCTVSVSDTFTWLGLSVLLVDMQIGTMAVMTFNYFVLLMVGMRLTVKDNIMLSPGIDEENVKSVPELFRIVIIVSVVIELLGAVWLYFCWQGNPCVPQDAFKLMGYALFHSVSTFCNFGLTLFPNNFAEPAIQSDYTAQSIMMVLILAGTMGFGVYLEVVNRVKRRIQGIRNPLRWSTHAWFVLRVTIVVTIAGAVGLTLIGWLEPSGQGHSLFESFWDGLWNSVGRSTGINRTDHSDYGPVYKIFMSLLMFIGSNPAGTGGGVFAPVFAICVLEVWRVLRGEHDVVIYNRCIAPSTISRAVSTLVLCSIWVIGTTMVLLFLEPTAASKPNGALDIFFMAVSAFATAGHSISDPALLSSPSKFVLTISMMLGRVGMFTTLLIFIKPRKPSPLRYPQTRLPLT